MPYAPGKICGRPLCNVRVPHGVTYCEQHEQEWREKRKARKSTKRKAQYLDPGDLSKWRRVRAAFLQRNSICAECGRPATVVDHIVPHRGDAALLWDDGKLSTDVLVVSLAEDGEARWWVRECSTTRGRGGSKVQKMNDLTASC